MRARARARTHFAPASEALPWTVAVDGSWLLESCQFGQRASADGKVPPAAPGRLSVHAIEEHGRLSLTSHHHDIPTYMFVGVLGRRCSEQTMQVSEATMPHFMVCVSRVCILVRNKAGARCASTSQIAAVALSFCSLSRATPSAMGALLGAGDTRLAIAQVVSR